MAEITKRKELVFLYDVTGANPNGDPDDENRPRRDGDGHNIVSDVRLKRTVRDYLINHGEKILIHRKLKPDGDIMNIEDLVTESLEDAGKKVTRENILKEIPDIFLDVRLFGLTAAVSGANVSITGPVQFGIGRSLNIPENIELTITSTMSAGSRGAGGAMGSTKALDYSLLAFEGVVCPHSAKNQEVATSEEDLDTLYKAIWWGTKTLNTRTKFNHLPRLLLVFESKDEDYLVGGLARLLKNPTEEQTSAVEFEDLVTRVKDCLEQYDGLEKLSYYEDPDLELFLEGTAYDDFASLWDASGVDVPAEQLSLEP